MIAGGQRGKVRTESKLRREASSSVSPPSRPYPRAESTQPRYTSPEPSSSGEETTEDSYPTPQSSHIAPSGSVNGHQGYQGHYDDRWAGAVVPIGGEEAHEELDPDGLLDLEYHPSYVRWRRGEGGG